MMKSSMMKTENAGAVKFTFTSMPANADEIRELLTSYPQTDKFHTAALFMTALVRYVESPEDGLAMIDALKGPQLLSTMDKSFIKDRFSDKKYLPRAYFEGAKPDNNYQPTEPWTLVLYEDPVAPPAGYSYVHVKTSGADSPRRIVMRAKGDQQFLWEYNGVLMSIRLPAEADPWL